MEIPALAGRVLLTRFSGLRIKTPVQNVRPGVDRLAHDALVARTLLFQIATLPSVLAQSDQDFDWLVLIDPELPRELRATLGSLLARRPRSHLVEMNAGDKMWRRRWLRTVLPHAGVGPLLTVNIDNDDALPRDHMQRLGRLAQARVAAGHIFPTLWGFLDPWQWDLRFTALAPLGTLARWHRRMWDGVRYPTSAGLALLSPTAHFDLTVLGIEHVSFHRTFESGFVPRHAHQRRGARLLRAAAASAGLSWEAWSSVPCFRALDSIAEAPLYLNHPRNEEVRRFVERKPDSRPMRGESSLPQIAIDWSLLTEYRSQYGGCNAPAVGG